MSFGSTLRRWFGADDRPLRSTMVSGIERGAQSEPGAHPDAVGAPGAREKPGATGAEQLDHPDNPFDDGHLTADWIPGTATIVELIRTGTLVGRSEVILVTLSVALPDEEPYAHPGLRQLVTPTSLEAWQPGNTVAVLVNPSDLSKLVVSREP